MAWEWVAPVATGVSGVVGVVFTWYAGHQGRKHAEKVAQQGTASQLALAREARRAEVYSEISTLQATLHAMLREEYSVKPLPIVSAPEREQLVRQIISGTARISIYGSEAVQQAFIAWTAKAMNLLNQGDDIEQSAALKELDDATARLRWQMNKELTS
ncbi:hypothetical protein GCM10009850_047910 [Nonomuraea monospora]|uniref:Protein kilB n=1 Tax=Nonomuraea monospora TaxID=568818 RepID=A0ABP5PFL2_9ACTN